MTMNIVKPTLYDLLYLCAHARQDDRAQYEAIMGIPWNVDMVAADHFNRQGVKFALLDVDGTPLAAAGWDLTCSPGVWNSWMVGTDKGWDEHWRSITKACRSVMECMFSDGSAHRLETQSIQSRNKACLWYMRGLKMQYEGTRNGVCKNGESILMYARVENGNA